MGASHACKAGSVLHIACIAWLVFAMTGVCCHSCHAGLFCPAGAPVNRCPNNTWSAAGAVSASDCKVCLWKTICCARSCKHIPCDYQTSSAHWPILTHVSLCSPSSQAPSCPAGQFMCGGGANVPGKLGTCCPCPNVSTLSCRASQQAQPYLHPSCAHDVLPTLQHACAC